MSTTTVPRWTCALFDVDGTLVDSAPQVTRAFEVALAERGLPVPSNEALRRYVGPPLWWSFSDLGYEGETVAELVVDYRRIYDGMFLDPLPFPGIGDLLKDLRSAGVPIGTATSKQEYMALAQIEHLGFRDSFDVIAGATPGPGSTKASVIADALDRLDALGLDASRPVLVGDSIWDVEGAKQAGIDVIGVTWGYSGPGDLDECVATVSSVADLEALLGL